MLIEAKEIAKQDTKAALQKAAEKKMQNPGKTATGQPADPVVQNPEVPGIIAQQYN